jgi:putative PIN family toxin of toxin-antitoxin system
MATRPRYVLDTNVIVSALLFPESAPGQAFFESHQHGEIILSTDTLGEIAEVLSRPKLDRYLPREERDWFLASLIRRSKIIEPAEQIRMCRDSRDDKWLELAVSGNAAIVVTGDNDLLVLQAIRDIPIMTAAQFIQTVR